MFSTTPDQPAGGSTRRTDASLVGWCCLALAIAFSLYVRIRLNSFPLERDEGEYAYAGQSILHGTPPYLLAYNMKLPGTYLAYAALMAIFGQTTAGIHAGLLAVNLLSIILLYRLSRRVFEPIAAGGAAAPRRLHCRRRTSLPSDLPLARICRRLVPVRPLWLPQHGVPPCRRG
jgi:hypothetical protein